MWTGESPDVLPMHRAVKSRWTDENNADVPQRTDSTDAASSARNLYTSDIAHATLMRKHAPKHVASRFPKQLGDDVRFARPTLVQSGAQSAREDRARLTSPRATPRAEFTSGQASGSRWATATGGLRNPEDGDTCSLALALNRVKLGASRKRGGFTIKFTRICAWHVPNTDENGLPDPYVRFTLEGGKDSRPPVGMTPDQRNQVNPKWEKPVRLRVPPTHQAAEQLCPVVLIALMDRDPEGEDEVLCQVHVELLKGKGQICTTTFPTAGTSLHLKQLKREAADAVIAFDYEIEPGCAAEDEDNKLGELEYSGGKWSKVSPPRPNAVQPSRERDPRKARHRKP